MNESKLTRENLSNGAALDAARGRATSEFPVLSDAELATSLQTTLKGRVPSDLWLFGYGSLIWNPAFDHVEIRPARLYGWHRSFCLLSTGRGTPEHPGITLGLDRGGSCRGIAYRILAGQVEDELRILWHREMLSGAYHARWLIAHSINSPLSVLAFTANCGHSRYVGHWSDTHVAACISSAHGPSGSCLEYFRKTLDSLAALNIRDASMQRILNAVEAVPRETSAT